MSATPQVDNCIDAMRREHPGVSKLAQSVYYEEVHQELAPLARQLERERNRLRSILQHIQDGQEMTMAFCKEIDDALADVLAAACGKISDGHPCTMPAGSECPDCCGIRGETIGAGD